MSSNLNAFYEQLQNNLSPSASQIGHVLIAVSFLLAISVFFLLIVINKFTEDPNSKNHDNAQIPKTA